MDKVLRAVMALLLAAAILLPWGQGAYALTEQDLAGNTGNVALTLEASDTGERVPGVEITLYRVGEVRVDRGAVLFVFFSSLAPVLPGDTLLNGKTADENQRAAAALWAYISAQGAPEHTSASATNADGQARFSGLPLGVYLVAQTAGNPSYSDITPFLLCIPGADPRGDWVFSLDIAPKIAARLTPTPTATQSPTPEPTPTPIPAPTAAPPPPNPPPKPEPGSKPDKLAQTGMVQWPITVMALLGLILFCVGWAYEARRRGPGPGEKAGEGEGSGIGGL